MKRYSLLLKSVAVFLAVILFLTMCVCGLLLAAAHSCAMDEEKDFDTWVRKRGERLAHDYCFSAAQAYASGLSDCPQWVFEYANRFQNMEQMENWYNLTPGRWGYHLQKNGATVSGEAAPADAISFTQELSLNYPVIALEHTSYKWVNHATGEVLYTKIEQLDGYRMTLWLYPDASKEITYFPMETARFIYDLGDLPLFVFFGAVVLFAVAFVYLMVASGRKAGTGEAAPAAVNRLPLDLYLLLGGGCLILAATGFSYGFRWLQNSNWENDLALVAIAGTLTAISLVLLGFFMALAAQAKMKNWYALRNTLFCRILSLLWRGIKALCRATARVMVLLPVIWQWLVTALVMGLGLVLAVIIFAGSNHPAGVIALLVWLLLCLAAALYGGYCFGVVGKAIHRMKEGDLQEKLSTGYLRGAFRTVGEDLNALADAVQIATQKQLKSERMKTELITNVSHDLKTPLTSIINFVDLLQNDPTAEEQAQYLTVLARQSDRMKKLLEDLLELSKASTGNIQAELSAMDPVEVVNQALGEYGDKLTGADLEVVLRTPERSCLMMADGRLTWRVLGNLLSNAVKYAQPGTRVYVNVEDRQDMVLICIKNISREPLNMDAQELMERFVRGDASRNTEGSGLGLNIAQSLMRLQKGVLELTVDGDLFKTQLIFPKA